MITVKGKLEGKDRIQPKLLLVGSKIGKIAQKAIAEGSVLLASHLRTERFSGGTTSTRLRVRSGRLRASVRSMKPEQKGNEVSGGVRFGTVYARVHVGPKGQKTKITPKRVKYLTIPLPAVQTRAGVARGPATSTMWKDTFVARSKAGNLIIFGKKTVSKGKRAGQATGGIQPLFLLVKSVTVPARVHPEEELKWMKPKMFELFRKSAVEFKEIK